MEGCDQGPCKPVNDRPRSERSDGSVRSPFIGVLVPTAQTQAGDASTVKVAAVSSRNRSPVAVWITAWRGRQADRVANVPERRGRTAGLSYRTRGPGRLFRGALVCSAVSQSRSGLSPRRLQESDQSPGAWARLTRPILLCVCELVRYSREMDT